MSGYWDELERPSPDVVVTAHGDELRPGARVRLAPRAGGDVFDLALAGRTAVIEAIEQDMEGSICVAVVLEDDPGRDLGLARQPGHRFFFSPSELDVLNTSAPREIRAGGTPKPAARRVLVAGIGNVFLADDGFGVAVADRLARRELGPGVEVKDFGIRGMDLAFAMQEDYEVVILLDATARGEAPGTLYVIEPEVGTEDAPPAIDTHGMDPAKVLELVRAFGGTPPRTLVVGCEPQTRMTGEEDEIVARLSEPVQAALDPAVRLVESLLTDINVDLKEGATP